MEILVLAKRTGLLIRTGQVAYFVHTRQHQMVKGRLFDKNYSLHTN